MTTTNDAVARENHSATRAGSEEPQDKQESSAASFLTRLRGLFDEAIESGSCSHAWADAAMDVLAESEPLMDDEDLLAAHILHRSLRAEASKDGMVVSQIATARAPDLRIYRTGEERFALSEEAPEELESLNDIIAARRSTPMYGPGELPLAHLSGILRAAFGSKGMEFGYQRSDIPRRAGASAGGLQSYDCQIIVNAVEDLEVGRYSYDPVADDLVLEERGDLRLPLVESTLESDFVVSAQAVLVLTGRLSRVSWKYGTRGYRYMGLDAGVVTGHVYLAAASLGVSVNALAAFADDAMNRIVRLDGRDEFTHLVIPLGNPPGPNRS